MSTYELSQPASKIIQMASPKIHLKDAIAKMKDWSYYFTEIVFQTTYYMPVRFGRNNKDCPKGLPLYIERAQASTKSWYPCDNRCQAFKKALADELGLKNTINVQDTPCIDMTEILFKELTEKEMAEIILQKASDNSVIIPESIIKEIHENHLEGFTEFIKNSDRCYHDMRPEDAALAFAKVIGIS